MVRTIANLGLEKDLLSRAFVLSLRLDPISSLDDDSLTCDEDSDSTARAWSGWLDARDEARDT